MLWQTVVDVEPLQSGRSREVSGRVVVTRRDLPLHPPPPPGGGAEAGSGGDATRQQQQQQLGVRELYFKLSDAGATYFATVAA